jgi:hypothetical protein
MDATAVLVPTGIRTIAMSDDGYAVQALDGLPIAAARCVGETFANVTGTLSRGQGGNQHPRSET